MTDANQKKESFKKCRSATFSIDGYSFTIGELDSQFVAFGSGSLGSILSIRGD